MGAQTQANWLESNNSHEQATMAQALKAQLEGHQRAFSRQPQPDYLSRIALIDTCIELLRDNHQSLCDAVAADFGYRSINVTRMSDIYVSLESLKFSRRHLKQWMRPEPRAVPLAMRLTGAKAGIAYQPKGVVGIMAPWNVPVNAVFSPLGDVLAAGNRAMVKPSELTPATSELIHQLVLHYFPDGEVTVHTGDLEMARHFSALPFDHLMFTGSTRVGRQVMTAAAANLTPVTLELGGKNPVVISEQVDMADAAEKIVSFKAMNAGQICLTPDYCLVPEAYKEAFIEACREVWQRQFPTTRGNPDYTSVPGRARRQALLDQLDEARAKGARVICLDEGEWQSGSQIPLHLVIDAPGECTLRQEEIFGPVLCIESYRSEQECIDKINQGDKPLALYWFGRNPAKARSFVSGTCSGAVCINDIAVHYACNDLPFGGVGSSGMGQFHGHEGFKTFSHGKPVFTQGRINLSKLGGLLPPWDDKMERLTKKLISR